MIKSKKISDNLKNIDLRNQIKLKTALEVATLLIANDMKLDHPQWPETITNPDGTTRYHNVTQGLSDSIVPADGNPTKVIYGRGCAESTVEARIEYAAKVELGSSKTRPYPFMMPALVKNKDNVTKIFAQILKV